MNRIFLFAIIFLSAISIPSCKKERAGDENIIEKWKLQTIINSWGPSINAEDMRYAQYITLYADSTFKKERTEIDPRLQTTGKYTYETEPYPQGAVEYLVLIFDNADNSLMDINNEGENREYYTKRSGFLTGSRKMWADVPIYKYQIVK